MRLTREDINNPLRVKLPQNATFRNLVTDKRVCVVGGASKSVDYDMINYADLVVGISKNWLICDHRVDITYSVIDNSFTYEQLENDPRLKELQFAWIWMQSDESYDLAKWCERNNISFSYYGLPGKTLDEDLWLETQWFRILGRCIQTLPFTGVAVIYHLLLHPVREVLATGMDFYCKDDQLLVAKHVHEVLPHINFLMYAEEQDKRLTLDERMKEVMEMYDKNRHKLGPSVVEEFYRRFITSSEEENLRDVEKARQEHQTKIDNALKKSP